MTLQAGTRVGTYEIRALLGVGGMGEVYRAHDAALGRDVAIKILPQAWLSDPYRRTRFDLEARVLASLNHSHIGAIYGLEDADGAPALVLELVEGQTLAERLVRPLPLNEALVIARQIAEALDAAHEKRIVHRDLKPANIKITPEGSVKVLDFGLAKAAGSDGSGLDFSDAPTRSPAVTGEGTVLGTVAYMSPEQARGMLVDKRTDVWAFGCVLYEMLTGRALFAKATVSDTLAAILEHEPEWSALPVTIPGTFHPGQKGKPEPFLESAFSEGAPAFSPDGRWLAYVSNETGRNEVYVRPYRGPGEKVTVSTEGGNEPVWPQGGRELFYRNGDTMFAVDITTNPVFRSGKPRKLFDKNYELSKTMWPNYDVMADGRQFLMIKVIDQEQAPAQINVILNWAEELKRRVPVK